MASGGYCSNCGAPVHPDAKFCASCGHAITAPEVPASETPPAPPEAPIEPPHAVAAAAPPVDAPPPKKGINGKKIVFGILIWPLGVYWLARRFGRGRTVSALTAVGGFVVLLIVIGAFGGSGSGGTSNRSLQPSPTVPTPTPAAITTVPKARPKPKPKAKPKEQWELIVSQSSCQESPTTTSVNCSIGVKNRGTTAGQPTVYADYHYTDGSDAYDQSNNGTCAASDNIPPGQLGYVYFCHNYDPLKHDLLRAAVTLNIGAKEWPYVRVADPNDLNWPSG